MDQWHVSRIYWGLTLRFTSNTKRICHYKLSILLISYPCLILPLANWKGIKRFYTNVLNKICNLWPNLFFQSHIHLIYSETCHIRPPCCSEMLSLIGQVVLNRMWNHSKYLNHKVFWWRDLTSQGGLSLQGSQMTGFSVNYVLNIQTTLVNLTLGNLEPLLFDKHFSKQICISIFVLFDKPTW